MKRAKPPDNMSAESESKISHRQLRLDLKEELMEWGKSQFRFIFVIVAAAGFFGVGAAGYALINTTVNQQVEKEINAALTRIEEDIKNSRARFNRLTEQANEMHFVAKTTLRNAAELAEEAKVTIERVIKNSEMASANSEEAARRAEGAIVQAQKAQAAAEVASAVAFESAKNAESVSEQLKTISQSSSRPDSEALSNDQIEKITIKQVAKATQDDAGGGKRYTRLTFSISLIEKDDDNKIRLTMPTRKMLSLIDKVEYIFPERWYDPPIRTSINAANDFQYSVRVWGSTSVTARIHILNPPRVILRRGVMDLKADESSPAFFKPV